HNQKSVASTAGRNVLPIGALAVDAMAEFVVTSLQIIIGQNAECESILFCFHLSKEARLVIAQPFCEYIRLFRAGRLSAKQLLMAFFHVFGKRAFRLSPVVRFQLCNEVTDRPHRSHRSPESSTFVVPQYAIVAVTGTGRRRFPGPVL